MLLVNLSKPPPPTPLPTAIADGALPVGKLRTDDMAAVVVMAKTGALAAVELDARTDPNLVNLPRLRAGRDKPTTAAEILKVFAVSLEESPATPNAIRDGFGGGVGYTGLDGHGASALLGREGPGMLWTAPGPSLYLSPPLIEHFLVIYK